jgi:RNA polymerase sigma factor (sigma-70 family)
MGRLPALVRFGFALTHDEGGAEDLVEGALVHTLLAWSEVVGHEDPEHYARRMMLHALESTWRRPRATPEPATASRSIPSTEFARDDAELVERDRVWRELVNLPPRQRAVLVLRGYEDRSEADVAAVLDCSVETVRNDAGRALATLRAGELVDRSVLR